MEPDSVVDYENVISLNDECYGLIKAVEHLWSRTEHFIVCLLIREKKYKSAKKKSKRGQRSGKSYIDLNHQINFQDRHTVVSWLWQLCQCSTETQSNDSSVLILHTCQDHWWRDSSLSRGAWESCHCARDVIPWSQKDKGYPAPEQKMMPNLVVNKLAITFSPEEMRMCL